MAQKVLATVTFLLECTLSSHLHIHKNHILNLNLNLTST